MNRTGCANSNYVNYHMGCWDDPNGVGYEHPVACWGCDGSDVNDTSCCLTNFPKVWFGQFKSTWPSGNVDSYYTSTIFATITKDDVVQGNRGPSDGVAGWNDDDGTIAHSNYSESSPNPYDNPIVAIFEGFPYQKKHCCGIPDGLWCTAQDTECSIKGLSPRFNHIGYTPDSPDVASDAWVNGPGMYNYQLYPANVCQELNNEDFVPDAMEGNYCDCEYSDSWSVWMEAGTDCDGLDEATCNENHLCHYRTTGPPPDQGCRPAGFPGATYGGSCAALSGGVGFNLYGQWGCQFPINPAPNFNNDPSDWYHPAILGNFGCTDPNDPNSTVPCVTPCIKGFSGPPLAMQDAIDLGTDVVNVSRFLNSDSVTPYPYPNTITSEMMYEIEVSMSGPSSEGFTMKVYDPVENSFRVIGCITINGANEDYGTPTNPMTFNYSSDLSSVQGCADPNSSLCNYNCAANMDCAGNPIVDGDPGDTSCCTYPDINCTGQCTPFEQTNQVQYYSDGDGDGKGCSDNHVDLCWGDDLSNYWTKTGTEGEEPCEAGSDGCNPPVLDGNCSADGGTTHTSTQCQTAHWLYGDDICINTHGLGYTCESTLDSLCNCASDYLDECGVCGGNNQANCVPCITDGDPEECGSFFGDNYDCNCECFGSNTFNSCDVCGEWNVDNNWGLPVCYEDTDLDGIGGCIGVDYNTTIISGLCQGGCPNGFSLIGGNMDNPCNDPFADPACTCDPYNECPGDTHFVDECGYCAELGQTISPYMGCDENCFGCPLCDQTNAMLGHKLDDCDECMEMQCVKPCENGIQTYICPVNDLFQEFTDQSYCNSSCFDSEQNAVTCVEYCNMTCYDNGGSYEGNIACNGNHMDNNPCTMFNNQGSWPSWIEYIPGLVPNNTEWNNTCIDCKKIPNGPNEYDVTGEENHYNCCDLNTQTDECSVCISAHGEIGGYVIEGTDNSSECNPEEGCSGPYYYSGPVRWYPDTDGDNLAYGINEPLIEQNQYGFCGQVVDGILTPGSKPSLTDSITNWIYFCPTDDLVTFGDIDSENCGTDGYPNCIEPFCQHDDYAECSSNIVDDCGVCDGPGAGVCGCGNPVPEPYVMDFDDNGQGYGHFINGQWAPSENWVCEADAGQLPSICASDRANELWIQTNSEQDNGDIKHCTDISSDSYYCNLNYGKCVCEYFINDTSSNPDVNGLPQNIIVSDSTQCIYLDFTYPSNNMLQVITQVDVINFEWTDPTISKINASSPWVDGTLMSLTYDADFEIKNSSDASILNAVVTVDGTTHASAVYNPDSSGELPVGIYTATLKWPANCGTYPLVSCLGTAEQDFEIVTPVYGCRDDGTLSSSNDPSGCCNSAKVDCVYVVDHWEINGEVVEECKPACNYNPDANVDGVGVNACVLRKMWYSDNDSDLYCCAEEDTSMVACGPIDQCIENNDPSICEEYWDLCPSGWKSHDECDGYFEMGAFCECPSNSFDDCGSHCHEPCCGTSTDSVCVGFQSGEEIDMEWNYNGSILVNNPCDNGEVPGNPEWNIACQGCSDPDATNYNSNATIPCTGKCYRDPDEDVYWTENCDENVIGGTTCPGRCSDNILKPCNSDNPCGEDDGTCTYGWVDDPDGLYDNYFNVPDGSDGWDNQGHDCCCVYDKGCVEPLSPSFGYGCPNPETGCAKDCEGTDVTDCLFGFSEGGVPVPANVEVVAGGDSQSETIQIVSTAGAEYIVSFMENEIDSYIRIGPEVLEVYDIFEFNNSYFMTVSRNLFETNMPEGGHPGGAIIYLENSNCSNNCCAHYTVAACMDEDGQDYYCYGDNGFPNMDNGACPDGNAPDTNWVTVVPCDFSTAQSVCEDYGWVNNGDGTYTSPDGVVTDLDGTANCCCEYKYDCADVKVTVGNYLDTAYIDGCGWCVGPGTDSDDFPTINDTRRIASDQYVCGYNPDGTNVICTPNWSNTGCGCWHPTHSPGVINPRHVYIENQDENAPDTWPDGMEGQLVWYFNSDNDGYGCYLDYMGCSLGLGYDSQGVCEEAGGIWKSYAWHAIKWQDYDELFQNDLSYAYETPGTIVNVYVGGTLQQVPFGKCINEYIQDGEQKDCFDENDICQCDDVTNEWFNATEEGRRANCSSYVYSYHKQDWSYCYEAPDSYIAPVCQDTTPVNWPLWITTYDDYNCGQDWIGFEETVSYQGAHPLYPDFGDPCACTGSGSDDDFGGAGSGVDQVLTDETAYATPGYYDCFGTCMGDGRRDACGQCYHYNDAPEINEGKCFAGSDVIIEGDETLKACCLSAYGADFDIHWDANNNTCDGVQYGNFDNDYSWRLEGPDVDCNGNCQWYTPIGRITGFNACLSEVDQTNSKLDDLGRLQVDNKYCTSGWIEIDGNYECTDWEWCSTSTKTNAFLDDLEVCSGGNTGHYPNKTAQRTEGWPMPYWVTNAFSAEFLKPLGASPYYCGELNDNNESNIRQIIIDQAPKIPTLPWNDYPGVDSDRDYNVAGAGIWGGPDLDCSCTSTIGVDSTNQAKVLSNLSWVTTSGNHHADSAALKCCSSGNEDDGIPYSCDGLQNPTHPNYLGDDTGCFYEAFIPNLNSYQTVGGMTCGCTGGSTNKVDDYCVGCAIQDGCPEWDPDCSETEPVEARNFNEPCQGGDIYLDGGSCIGMGETACDNDENCQWSDVMGKCYPLGELIDNEDWTGGACLLDDGSCDYCECGFNINWDPGGNYTVNVLLDLMCNLNDECPSGSFCTGCKCQEVIAPQPTGTCVDVSNYYPKCGAFYQINSYDTGCGDAQLYAGTPSQWANMCWWNPKPSNTFGCGMPFVQVSGDIYDLYELSSGVNGTLRVTPDGAGAAPVYSWGDGWDWSDRNARGFPSNSNTHDFQGPCAGIELNWWYVGWFYGLWGQICDECGSIGGYGFIAQQCTFGPGLIGPLTTAYQTHSGHNCSNDYACSGASWDVEFSSDGEWISGPRVHETFQYTSDTYYTQYGWIGTGKCQNPVDTRGIGKYYEYMTNHADATVMDAGVMSGAGHSDCDVKNRTANFAGISNETIPSCDTGDINSSGCQQTKAGTYPYGSPYLYEARKYAATWGGVMFPGSMCCPYDMCSGCVFCGNSGWSGCYANCSDGCNAGGAGGNDTACHPFARISGLQGGSSIGGAAGMLYRKGEGNLTNIVDLRGSGNSGNVGCGVNTKSDCTVGYSLSRTKSQCSLAHGASSFYTNDTGYKRTIYMGNPTSQSTMWSPKVTSSHAFGKSGLRDNLYTSADVGGLSTSNSRQTGGIWLGGITTTTHRPSVNNSCPTNTTLMEEKHSWDDDHDGDSVFISNHITNNGDFYGNYQNCNRGWWCTKNTTSTVTGVRYKSCPTRNSNTDDNKSWPWYDCLAFRCYINHGGVEPDVIACIKQGMVEDGEWPEIDASYSPGDTIDMGNILPGEDTGGSGTMNPDDPGGAGESAEAEEEQIEGCTDSSACNYNANANVSGYCNYTSCTPIGGSFIYYDRSDYKCQKTDCYNSVGSYSDWNIWQNNNGVTTSCSPCGDWDCAGVYANYGDFGFFDCYGYESTNISSSNTQGTWNGWANLDNEHTCCAHMYGSSLGVGVSCSANSSYNPPSPGKHYACHGINDIGPEPRCPGGDICPDQWGGLAYCDDEGFSVFNCKNTSMNWQNSGTPTCQECCDCIDFVMDFSSNEEHWGQYSDFWNKVKNDCYDNCNPWGYSWPGNNYGGVQICPDAANP